MRVSKKIYYDFKNSDNYLLLSTLRSKYKRIIAHKKTDLIIEGYPRSANTFSKVVVELSNPRVSIAHHMHSRAQIVRGIKYQIPTIVLLRNPKDAISSLIIKTALSNNNLDRMISEYAYYYSVFYREIESFIGSIFLVNFESVTKSPNQFIESIGQRYNLDLESFKSDDDAISTVFDVIKMRNISRVGHDSKKLAIPSVEKESYKSILDDKIQRNEYYRNAYNTYLKMLSVM